MNKEKVYAALGVLFAEQHTPMGAEFAMQIVTRLLQEAVNSDDPAEVEDVVDPDQHYNNGWDDAMAQMNTGGIRSRTVGLSRTDASRLYEVLETVVNTLDSTDAPSNGSIEELITLCRAEAWKLEQKIG